ncbi:MAG: WYL domain-containing protein, partial [Lachnospiraceae bacterium]|nr:WYL domain-containing protein [Lachnospiraceae bacterium]
MKDEGKLRLLNLYRILYERTDEDHPLSTTQLISILKNEYEISAYRTTVTRDVEVLRDFGVDICEIKSTQNKYYILSREFETPELKLLIDAVESSKLISNKKSAELVSKLEKMTSVNTAQELKRNLCTEGRIKPANEKVFYIVDAINNAINKEKKIAFRYMKYDSGKVKRARNNNEEYIFSPYTLLWNGD